MTLDVEFLNVENTNFATLGFGLDISFLYIISQMIPKLVCLCKYWRDYVMMTPIRC